MSGIILIAYDGSEQAKRAIAYAGEFFHAERVHVLTVWEPTHHSVRAAAGEAVDLTADPAYPDARRLCEEGVALAREYGLPAKAHLVESQQAVWETICDAAQQLQVGLIVSGTRGASGLRGVLSASTAELVLHNSGLPVLIVPPQK
ncbi:universal stress protein [Corynebacterium sp. TAE3-ERU12]|uniref:universal stress protein n=1 Tax=Corynebacterium sp. TAE3-ERU12 TaxID=2849491 RepID=UPI001C44C694|nr:universal stress protein [Corynebacterium sp. TAE3-ERU12]MBV7296031.1 universal stress protein [Corynebacterium sp. TAE3-ERU12]